MKKIVIVEDRPFLAAPFIVDFNAEYRESAMVTTLIWAFRAGNLPKLQRDTEMLEAMLPDVKLVSVYRGAIEGQLSRLASDETYFLVDFSLLPDGRGTRKTTKLAKKAEKRIYVYTTWPQLTDEVARLWGENAIEAKVADHEDRLEIFWDQNAGFCAALGLTPADQLVST